MPAESVTVIELLLSSKQQIFCRIVVIDVFEHSSWNLSHLSRLQFCFE